MSKINAKAAEQFAAQDVRNRLLELANADKAKHMLRYFKTGPGEYGEGDTFLGISTPNMRSVVKQFRGLELSEAELLIADKTHEMRMVGLLILVDKFKKAKKSESERKAIIDCYLANLAGVNNWDLVDLSCGIVGEWVLDKDRQLLYDLASSSNMWSQRVAMVSTLVLVRSGEFADALALAELLLSCRHDLMHKAVGWVLREVGKKDVSTLEAFLRRFGKKMPRTTLRYAIERFENERRLAWLHGELFD